jgi:hypothetical protein
MGDSQEERIARNNVTFREANEKIRAKADEYDAPLERIPFLCECARPDCVEILRLTLDEYRKVRSNPAHFVAAIGHEEAEDPVGRVVSESNRYVIIEKAEAG